SREELERDTFAQVLVAAEQRQALARAVWRSSRAGRETQRFGDAFIRGYRFIRRLASGPTSDLFVGESERAGRLVALKVARDRQIGRASCRERVEVSGGAGEVGKQTATDE